jgi:hypothetical protein
MFFHVPDTRLAFDLMLLGVAVHQFITYMSTPGNDRLYVRITVVSSLFLLSTQWTILTGISTGRCLFRVCRVASRSI